MKFEIGPGFTHNQALMMMTDFYINSQLPKGKIFKGKELTKDEELSPLAENFIIEKCLSKIDPRLPDHVKNTRGHLFTEQRPTLACNKKLLFDQIDTMLSELDGNGRYSGNISVGQVRQHSDSLLDFRSGVSPGSTDHHPTEEQAESHSAFPNTRPPFARISGLGHVSGCIR